MKPLELRIFERHPGDGQPVYRFGPSYTPYAIVATDKRFTDAELAAEFERARADYAEASNHPSGTYWTPLDVTEDATAGMAMKRAMMFLRFATLPHFDEDEE